MNLIINIRIEDNKIVIVKLNTGEIITLEDMYVKMMFGNKYKIKTIKGQQEIKFNKEGTKIIFPSLKDLEIINTL